MNQFGIILPLLQFDFMDVFIDWEEQSVIPFNKEALSVYQEEFSPQMQTIGYKSYNSIIILNTIGLMMVLYVIQVIFYFILKAVHVCVYNEDRKGPGKRIYQNL